MPTDDELPIQPCLECKEPYKVTREDRKFCSDMCRTAYNNRRRKEQPPEQTETFIVDWRPDFYQQINAIIARNRYIMEYLISMDFRAIDKHDLEGYGFNFKYFTSEYTDPEFGAFRFCYDHGYQFDPNGRRVHFLNRTEEILC